MSQHNLLSISGQMTVNIYITYAKYVSLTGHLPYVTFFSNQSHGDMAVFIRERCVYDDCIITTTNCCFACLLNRG